ncbi:MAG: DUF58 domain-containing protein [Phycisphaerales bacterium]|nr:MAG: DUF58 domain-containing protein [Phycisphaerales bacterium]
MMALVWYGSVVAESNLLLLLCGMFAGLLIISTWIVTRAVRRLSVQRLVSESAVVGTDFSIHYRMHNPRRCRVRSVWISELVGQQDRLALPETYVPAFEPNSTILIEQRGRALRRGPTSLDRVALWSRFPFGLVRARRIVSLPRELIVLPRLYSVRGDAFGLRGRHVAHSSASRRNLVVRHQSGADDFLGLREYRHGDSLRWVYWRRSARTGQLVIRQMYPYRSSGFTIVVDHRMNGTLADPEEQRERAVSAAASMACHALERGLRVGLIILARRPGAVPPVSGRIHRAKIMMELALMQGEPKDDLAEALGASGRRALQGLPCVLVTCHQDKQVRCLEESLAGTCGEVKVCRPGAEDFDAVFDRPLGSTEATVNGPPRPVTQASHGTGGAA